MGITKSWASALVLLFVFLSTKAWASDYSLDNTCKNCSRREMDSLNVFKRRPIRVNQAGFRPQDTKKALVANAKLTTWKLLDIESGKEAMSGSLTKLGAPESGSMEPSTPPTKSMSSATPPKVAPKPSTKPTFPT